MIRSKETEDLVARFAADIGEIVARGQRDVLEGVRQVLEGQAPPASSRRARGPAPSRRSTQRGSTPEQRPLGGARAVDVGEVARPPRAGDADRPAASSHDGADHEPSSPRQAATELTDRAATVLDAVRQLVRGTAAEIALHCGLPNGTVYVVLRALLTKGSIAKTDTARGVEYSLVSSGGIRPFKRVKSGALTGPESTHTERPPLAAVES